MRMRQLSSRDDIHEQRCNPLLEDARYLQTVEKQWVALLWTNTSSPTATVDAVGAVTVLVRG